MRVWRPHTSPRGKNPHSYMSWLVQYPETDQKNEKKLGRLPPLITPSGASHSTRMNQKRSSDFSLGLATSMFLWLPLLAACDGQSTPSGPTVSALDNEFSPKELQISVGQTVTWTNHGQTTHTVTADDNSFDSGDFDPGKSFTHTFTKAGRYPYYCQLHGAAGGVGMAGVIIVGNSSSTGVLAGEQQPSAKAPAAILPVPEDYAEVIYTE